MIDYGKGYACSWRLMEVDPDTWADSSEITGMLSASVERNSEDRLFESGSVSLDSQHREVEEFWGRIEMLAESGGDMERHAVATFIMSPTKSTSHIGMGTLELEGRSVLAPADDRVLLAGSYAPAGADGAQWAASLIAECTPAPVTAAGEFRLADNVVFAQGTTFLEAARMVVDAAGWCIRVSGSGEVTVMPKPSEPSLVLDEASMSILGPEVTYDLGASDVPNRYIAVDGDEVGIAVDDDPDSPTSIIARGRYVDVYDESPTRVDGETVQAYAKRRLAESAARGTFGYTREWQPGVTCFDLVRGALPGVGLDGDMRVVSQSLELGNGVKVSETTEAL